LKAQGTVVELNFTKIQMNSSTMHLSDGYKTDHRRQYPVETRLVYSNWTPRKSRLEGVDKVVFFGLQGFIKKYLIEDFNNNFFDKPRAQVVSAYARRINNYLGENRVGVKHIEALHDLGYLPICIKALPEGTRSPIRVPQLTIVNTHDDFFWLVNYLETLISCELWGPSTSATIAYSYREIFTKWALKTGAPLDFIQFQGHDFSMRGMFGVEAAKLSGAGHLTSFVGTDTIPAIDYLEEYYNADSDKELVGCSIAATEHAVMCVGTGFYIQQKDLSWEKYGEAEFEVFKRLLTEVYPTGRLSVVSDTWNLWTVLTDYIPRLKDIILARDGKLVIRPDSGDPVDIMCGKEIPDFVDYTAAAQYFKNNVNGNRIFKVGGVYSKVVVHAGSDFRMEDYKITPVDKGVVEILWDIFGGTVTDKGFKMLDPHVGAIYGDSITRERAKQICARLYAKGFASSNVVFGIGSYTYQYNTRDTLGFAMKATYAEAEVPKPKFAGDDNVETIEIEIFKDPITDDGTKKSLRGLICIVENDSTGGITAIDQCSWEEEEKGLLEEVFLDGELVRETTLAEVRNRLWSQQQA
jgi:nicotinamide phosphoribosyltransferase